MKKENYTPIKVKVKPKQKKRTYAWKLMSMIGMAFFALIVLLNFVASQMVPSLYFSFVNEDREAVVSFLQAIQPLPEFNSILAMQKEAYDDSITHEVFAQTEHRDAEISQLESLLQSNPQAPEVMYKLSVLYKEKGDTDKSEIYLEKAREIDPTL